MHGSTKLNIADAPAYALGAAFATAWFLLGFNSDQVPFGSEAFWVVGCGAAGGAAIATARYQTLFALRSYCVIATAVGVVRSVAYLNNGSGGPAFVWLIVALTTLAAYLLAIHKYEGG